MDFLNSISENYGNKISEIRLIPRLIHSSEKIYGFPNTLLTGNSEAPAHYIVTTVSHRINFRSIPYLRYNEPEHLNDRLKMIVNRNPLTLNKSEIFIFPKFKRTCPAVQLSHFCENRVILCLLLSRKS